MSDASSIDSFISSTFSNIVANIVTALLFATGDRIKSAFVGEETEQVLREVFSSAIGDVLVSLGIDPEEIDSETDIRIADYLTTFFSREHVANILVECILQRKQIPIERLSREWQAFRFNTKATGFVIEFEEMAGALTTGLRNALRNEIASPNSLLKNRFDLEQWDLLFSQLTSFEKTISSGITAGLFEAEQTKENKIWLSALNDYLTGLNAYCELLPYVSLPGQPFPPLSTIYVEQSILKDFSQEQGLNKRNRAVTELRTDVVGTSIRSKRVLPLTQVLSKHTHILLMGEPGVGKSTALNFIILSLIQKSQLITLAHLFL